MAMRLFLVYVLVELAVVVALASTIGFGWTVLLLVGTFALGLALAGSQVKRQIQRLQSGLADPRGALSDGVLVALGTILTVVPGLVTLRARSSASPAAHPRARASGRWRAGRPRAVPDAGGHRSVRAASGAGAPPFRPGRGDYIDGEVLDVTDDVTEAEPPNLPRHTD